MGDMIGSMRHFIEIISAESDKDSQGFALSSDNTIAKVRAYKEIQRSNEAWKNRATFSTADTLFRFRMIPGLTITTAMSILCNNERYNIVSVEDVRSKGMFTEILAIKVKPSGG